MNLEKTLKHFKMITPDAERAAAAKRAILAFPQMPARRAFGVKMALFRTLEAAAGVVLVGFFILFITGGFADSPYFSPVQLSVVDQRGFRAEAQAIDIQIKLANLNYAESSVPAAKAGGALPKIASSLAPGESGPTPTTTPTSSLSIDEALQRLSQ